MVLDATCGVHLLMLSPQVWVFWICKLILENLKAFSG